MTFVFPLLLVFLASSPTFFTHSELVFIPNSHSLHVITSNVIIVADQLSSVMLNDSTSPASPSDTIFEELRLSQMDLTRETNTLRHLLQPLPPLPPRSRRSIWGWFGIASTHDISDVNQQLALAHQREGLTKDHLDLIDKTLVADHQLVNDLLLSEERDFSSLLDKLRHLSLLQAAAHLSSLVHSCRERVRSLTSSFLQGRLIGHLAAPGQETIIVSMGRRG